MRDVVATALCRPAGGNSLSASTQRGGYSNPKQMRGRDGQQSCRLGSNNEGGNSRIGCLSRRNVLATMAKNARHPDQLIKKLVHSSDITLIEQSSPLIEKRPNFSEIDVFENCH